MKNLLYKEVKLSASKLSFIFILFSLLLFVPSYPLLLSAFFVCLGIFQTFQKSREANDILYSSLLPIKKSDIVKGRFLLSVMVEIITFLFILIFTLIRMSFLSDIEPYKSNALMNPNFYFLFFVLLIFGLFNLIFINGYYKTAYYFSKPFLIFIIVNFIVIFVAEALHFIPSLSYFNSLKFDNLLYQLSALIIGIVVFIIMTCISYKRSVKSFAKIDL